jgi:cation:H+ antiporter
MIYLIYLILAVLVTALSVKASHYVDLLEKKTTLSGAFIGGILLSAVTSLPELFTSISSTLFLQAPELCLGNILGSNLFNVAALSVVILICCRSFLRGKISKNHTVVLLLVLICYLALAANFFQVLAFSFGPISITSVVLFACYLLSVRFLSGEEEEESDESTSALTLRQVIVRFVLVSIGIVISSILITYATDAISAHLGLAQGFAGALLLGIATSLPELASTVTLFRMGNFDIAVGNIVGSCIFNLLILVVVDILYRGSGLYTFSDSSTQTLMLFGAVAMGSTFLLLRFRSKYTTLLCPFLTILCYLGFLIIG